MLYILGSTGFIGNNISAFARLNGYDATGVPRSRFDIADPDTYNTIQLKENDTIIDCIARIDGTREELVAVNQIGVSRFIDYLNDQKVKYHYLFFSSYSTVLPEIRNASSYIETKYEAEQMIKQRCNSSKIVRLIFPFGIGEKRNRLISRLINRILSREPIVIDDFTTNLTPISALMDDFKKILESKLNEINYSTDYVYQLEEVLKYMYEKMGVEQNYTLSGRQLKLLVDSDIKTTTSQYSVLEELDRMINAQR